jgi:CubicO group peptidase (beta-lactamase class C family)
MRFFFLTIVLLFSIGCTKNGDNPATDNPSDQIYFPDNNTSDWETATFSEIGWNESSLNDLLSYMQINNTRAFLILKNGKIVVEKYWGNEFASSAPFTKNSLWMWASAGKTLTATLVGIAQKDGLLNINQKTSDFLGTGWTSMPLDKENLITIRHQLTMTTGLEYNVPDEDCTLPSCLSYKADAGTQWYYHNAPYTLLSKVVSKATGADYNTYTDQKIESIIGMNGQWRYGTYNNVYWSSARDMARFGLLILNKGKWKNTDVLSDEAYYNQMVNTSQDLNPSYGYLWWLNGKSSIIPASTHISYPVELAYNAPDDMIAAMGKNGQFINIIPSEKIIVIRMGEAPDNSLVPYEMQNEMWSKINLLIN